MKHHEIIDVHDLKLHESTRIQNGYDSVYVLRIPGGWLYHWNSHTSVFVPLNFRDAKNSGI